MSFSRLIIFPFKFKLDRHKKQSARRFVNETNVSKEYLDVFRTSSYMDICHKVQSHIHDLDINQSFSSSSKCIDNILFEPEKETMANLATTTFDMHCSLILDFLNAGVESWKVCEKLLQSVHQANTNHHRIINIVLERVPRTSIDQLQKEVDLYSSLPNPLSDFNPEKFTIHLKLLLKRLTTTRTRIKRKRKLITCMKKGVGCALVASYTVLATALLVLAFHGLVGIVTSPMLIIACSLTSKAKMARKGLQTGELKRIGVLLDVAAKGIYTLMKDFDTIGSLAGRLQDEVEFGKLVARNSSSCVGNYLKSEVVRDQLKVQESRLTEQTEELKDHIYLCLLNVNRSRKALVEDIIVS